MPEQKSVCSVINHLLRDAEMGQRVDLAQQRNLCPLSKLENDARLQIPRKQRVTNQSPRLHRLVFPVILKKIVSV
jgi:hypothetical protein